MALNQPLGGYRTLSNQLIALQPGMSLLLRSLRRP
jgi:hypothetical protein